jgi:hypothetical protein
MILKEKSIQSVLEGAGIRVPAGAAKAFYAAVERFRWARGHRAETIAALDSFERQSAGREVAMDQLKATLGVDLANGTKTEAEVSAAIRDARNQEDFLT